MQLREKLNMMAMCRGQSSQSAKASAGEEGTKSTVAEVEDVVHKLREQEEPEDGHRTVEGQIDDAIDDELNEFEKGQCYVCIIIIITATTTTTTIIIFSITYYYITPRVCSEAEPWFKRRQRHGVVQAKRPLGPSVRDSLRQQGCR